MILTGKHINKYYKKYALFFLIGILMLVAVDYIQLLIPEYLGKIIDIFDAGKVQECKDQIILMSLYTIFCGLGMFLGRLIWRYTLFYASQKIDADLRHDMFIKAENLSIDYYQVNKVGTIMAWFTSDLETIEEYVGFGTVMMVDAVFMSILTLIKMFNKQWQLTIIVLIPVILIIIWGAIVEKFMEKIWDNRQKEFDRLYDYAQESFTGIRVIKAFVKETHELHAFAKVAKKNKDVNISFMRTSVIFDAIIEVIIGILLAIIIGFGGYVVMQCTKGLPVNLFGVDAYMTGGDLITFIGYMDSLIWPTIALGQIITWHARAKASLNRINNYLDSSITVTNPDNPIYLKNVKGLIEFKNFSFAYPVRKEKNILNGVSITINPGEKIGIVGRVGCGKSTIANSLLRLYNVNRGQVFIDGYDIMDLDIDTLRQNIGYVPQDNFLFSDTVKSNIAFSDTSIDHDSVVSAAKFANVHDDIDKFNNKYETITGERGVSLSGGQKQRISIARAYIKNAPILIFDDSVSAVDISTEEQIFENLKQKRANMTTLVVASRISTVSHMDKVLVLDEGKVEAFDTPQNLLKVSPTYKKMVYLQKLQSELEGGK